MPLYEYRCQKCGSTFEKLQHFSDDPLKTHEGCGGEVERLISAPALQFKGTGWYITDYAKKNGSSANGSSKKAESTPPPAKSDSSSASASTTPASKP